MKYLRSMMTVLFLLALPMTATFAAVGCCSGHGGVKGCAATGFQQCHDKSISASCTCKPAPANTHNKITGCCSGHKGVDKCNKTTGFKMCKDGSTSTTCKCK